ncbi:MAG: M48 family metalloprotease, partial [Thiohalomonadales bacterium]
MLVYRVTSIKFWRQRLPYLQTFGTVFLVTITLLFNNIQAASRDSINSGVQGNPPSTLETLQLNESPEEQLDHLIADIKYIRELTYTFLRNSARFCKKTTVPAIGLFFTNQFDLDAKIKDAAKKRYKLIDQLRIIQLLPGFPAKQQGLLVGDILLSINNIPFSFGENSLPTAYKLLQDNLRLRRPSKITVNRGSSEVAFSVTPITICNFPPVLSNSKQAYAYGNGKQIIISRGLLNTSENKAHIASIITHELAHNMLRHPTQQVTVNKDYQFELKSAVIGLYALNYDTDWQEPPYSQAFELEADYIGIKLMALSNFPIAEAGNFLRKITTTNDGDLWTKWQIKHPTTLNRFVAIEQIINEIMQKKRAGDITYLDGADLDKLRRIRENRLASPSTAPNNKAYDQRDEAKVWAEKSFQGLQNGDWAQAMRTASTAIALDPLYIVPYINRSLAYINTGDIQKALKDIESALRIEPNNGLALNNRGYAYQLLDQPVNARADYNLACKLKEMAACQNYEEITGYRPEEIEVAVQTLLDSTYEKFAEEDWEAVISISTKVLDLQPYNVVALVNRAGALAEKGRLRESLQDSNTAIKIDPNYAIAYHNKGYVYELMEKYTNSI